MGFFYQLIWYTIENYDAMARDKIFHLVQIEGNKFIDNLVNMNYVFFILMCYD